MKQGGPRATPDANAALRQEIAERKAAERALRESEAQLGSELRAMHGLHDLSMRLVREPERPELLADILDSTVALQHADFGNIQVYDPSTETLSIVAQRGFTREFLAHFRTVDATGESACARALARRDRVVVEDVDADPVYAPHRAIAARAGYRAVQSTPMFGRDGRPLGVLSTHFRQRHRPSDRDLRLTDLYARLAVELVERGHLAAERERLAVAEAVAVERQALLKRFVEAQEEERRHVAHEVHDSVTQLATAAALRLDDLAERLSDALPPEDLDDLVRARDLARAAAAEARRLIAGLRPEALEDFGLAGALRQEVAAHQAAGWPATFEDGDPDAERLSHEAEITLYRVAQEALTNVRRHAGRARVRVRLQRIDGSVRLEVRDWGPGFDQHAVHTTPAGEHVGLASMRERMALLGGRLEVRSGPQHGTTIRAIAPLAGTYR